MLPDSEPETLIQHLHTRQKLTANLATMLAMIFFIIIHRHFRSGFDLLQRRISWDAGMTIRVTIDSLVYSYRIFQNSNLAKVFLDRHNKDESEKLLKKEFMNLRIPKE